LSLPSSRAVHPNEQEAKLRYQEAFMDEKGAPGKTPTKISTDKK